MAFDVYVGTMTRLFRREWENAGQRMSREQGMKYTMIYAGGDPPPPQPSSEIQEAVKLWCNMLNSGLKHAEIEEIQWDESDEKPYFTDRPGWEGYAALLIWAAHADHPDMPIPAEASRSWADDPAYIRSVDPNEKSSYRTILIPEIWLPARFPFIFDAPTLASEEPSPIGSVFTLKEQLDLLYSSTKDAFAERKRNYVPKKKEAPEKKGIFGGLFQKKKPAPEPEPEVIPLGEVRRRAL